MRKLTYLSIAPVLAYVFFFEIGAGPVPWMMASEIMPTKYKAAVAALGASANWFNCFLVGLLFPPLNDLMDQYVFVIFTVTCGLSALYIKVRGVESKGKTVEEVQAVYRQRLGLAANPVSNEAFDDTL